MNFYNPFKPHIVRNPDGSYSVRRIVFPFLFAQYLEEHLVHRTNKAHPSFYWWSLPEYFNKYCRLDSTRAAELLTKYQAATKNKPKPVYVPLEDILK